MAILLRVGMCGEDVVQVGQRILQIFGEFSSQHKVPVTEVQAQHDIGEAKAAIELGRRLALEFPEDRLVV